VSRVYTALCVHAITHTRQSNYHVDQAAGYARDLPLAKGITHSRRPSVALFRTERLYPQMTLLSSDETPRTEEDVEKMGGQTVGNAPPTIQPYCVRYAGERCEDQAPGASQSGRLGDQAVKSAKQPTADSSSRLGNPRTRFTQHCVW
jgi:hypothetical protein